MSFLDHHTGFVNATSPEFVEKKINFLLGCLDRGWWIFQLRDILFTHNFPPACSCAKGEACRTIGKHPLGLWTDPPRPDLPRTRKWVQHWVTHKPTRGWGVHLGLSGLWAIDIDTKLDGYAELAIIQSRNLLPALVKHVLTPSGGCHMYFKMPPGENHPRKGLLSADGVSRFCGWTPAPGVDVWAGQHYLVLPYSPHRCGKFYEKGTEPMPGESAEERVFPL